MRKAPRVPPETLYPRRVAMRALELVLGHKQMDQVAMKLNPDDPAQAFPGAVPGEVRIYERGWDQGQKALAQVFLELEAGRARVVIPAARALVRPAHRKDFRPEDLGIQRERGEPDIDMLVDLSPVLDGLGEAMRTVPQRALARARRGAVGGTYRGVLGLGRRR